MPIVAITLLGKREREPLECLYHQNHFWDECCYLNDKIRPEGWLLDKSLKEEIIRKLKSNEGLRIVVKNRLSSKTPNNKKKKNNRNKDNPNNRRKNIRPPSAAPER